MNDFTKEELTEIHRCLKYMTQGGTSPYSTFTIDLMRKARAMIDGHGSLANEDTKCQHMLDPDDRICMTCHEYVPPCGHHVKRLQSKSGMYFIEQCPQCKCDPNQPMFTRDQQDHICYQIGDWYLMMKPLLEGRHNLGYMKEKLKTMICGE